MLKLEKGMSFYIKGNDAMFSYEVVEVVGDYVMTELIISGKKIPAERHLVKSYFTFLVKDFEGGRLVQVFSA